VPGCRPRCHRVAVGEGEVDISVLVREAAGGALCAAAVVKVAGVVAVFAGEMVGADG
jgi:hypothetical protein